MAGQGAAKLKPLIMENKMENFRDDILLLAGKAVKIMEEYFDGERQGTDKIKEAARMITEGVKVSNRDQVDSQVKRSQAVRLLSYIPKEKRADYIALTNPEAKPFLLGKPE